MSVDNSKNEMNKFNNNSRNSKHNQTVNRSIENLKTSRDQRREDRVANKALPTIQEDFVDDDYADHSRLGLVKKNKHSNKENMHQPLSVRDSYDQSSRMGKNYRALGPPKELLQLPNIQDRSPEQINQVYLKH